MIGFAGALIISREIWVSALRDFNSRNNNLSATKVLYIAKIKTTIQIFTIFIYLVALSFNKMLLIVIGDIFLIISVLITIYSGYIYTLNTLKIKFPFINRHIQYGKLGWMAEWLCSCKPFTPVRFWLQPQGETNEQKNMYFWFRICG